MSLLKFYFLSLAALGLLCSLAAAKKDSKIHHIKTIPSVSQHLVREHEPKQPDGAKSRHPEVKSHLKNKHLLSKLGLSKIRVPASHNRKRLAVESRHHPRPNDSHMFIIKLPPNGVYYSNTKIKDDKNSVNDNGKKVSFNFRSNGKPGRIYHWNIPVMKKIFSDTNRLSAPMFRHNKDISDLIDIKSIPTWSKPWENETLEKPFGKITAAENKSLKKKKSPTYYAPAAPKKNNFQKYFPGNGKPKGFYVMKKNQKPAYYKELIP